MGSAKGEKPELSSLRVDNQKSDIFTHNNKVRYYSCQKRSQQCTVGL